LLFAALRFLAILFAIVIFASSCSSTKHKIAGAELDRLLSAGEMIVSVEDIPGRSAGLGRVTGVIDAPRDRVWKVICDYNEQKNFMPNILERFVIRPEALKLIKTASPGDLAKLEDKLKDYKTENVRGDLLYTYSRGDFPWPVPDKRYVLRIERDRDLYMIRSSMVLGQMNANETSWELKPYGPDGSKTLATYQVVLDPGISMPRFAINMAANSALLNVIKAVRKRVKDERYAGGAVEGGDPASFDAEARTNTPGTPYLARFSCPETIKLPRIAPVEG
jgi:hypothetical protein